MKQYIPSRSLDLINATALLSATEGEPTIAIGLIDGPVAITHPDLANARLQAVTEHGGVACSNTNSMACQHGTFVASILCARRGSPAAAICPGCTVLVRPVFSDVQTDRGLLSSSTPALLAQAIVDVMNAGARIVNLSSAIAEPSSRAERELEDVLHLAARRGVLIIAAAGNQGTLGSTAITRHRWVIPVVACDASGRPIRESNLSGTIGRSGVAAPGEDIMGLNATGQAIALSGTSVAAPFVTGTAALLWSLYPSATASQIRAAIAGDGLRNTLVPQLLNGLAAATYLRRLGLGGKGVA